MCSVCAVKRWLHGCFSAAGSVSWELSGCVSRRSLILIFSRVKAIAVSLCIAFLNINWRSDRPILYTAFAFVFCRYSILANGTLVVRRVDDSDVGVYKCVGIGRTGPAQAYAAELLLACKSPIFTMRELQYVQSRLSVCMFLVFGL